MQIFYTLYNRSMQWAIHPRAYWYLAGISFFESLIITIPTEIILIPMSLTHPQQTQRLTTIATLASALGGTFGYAIGWFTMSTIQLFLHYTGDWQNYLRAQEWLAAWNVNAIFLAAIALIPYRIFAIVAGNMKMAFIPFLIATIIGRSIRFFLIATIISIEKSCIEHICNKYSEYIGWITTSLIISIWFYYA
jgi:membrane protein YqaA with SNARE-associated domain